MCGFVALLEPGRTFPTPWLDVMEKDIHHRGPDSGGRLSEPGFAQVFRRLAILDPHAEADQPMTSDDGRFSLVFNGEIYNFQSLRQELESHGIPFHTSSDTEVLLNGYQYWGEAILDRLQGMFAFVLIDRKEQKAFAARDPFGIKPLYAIRQGNLTGFASEARPLARLVGAKADPTALAELLTFGWAAGELSNLKGIERVLPGTLITTDLSNGSSKRRRFFDALGTIGQESALSKNDAIELSRETVCRSVSEHLISDVGYTLQLSGGVDSSLISALAAKETNGQLESFSIDIEGYEHNERPWREKVIEQFGLTHHEVAMDGVTFADALPRAVRHMEGPVPHGGCVLLMLLCDVIRNHSKVVLTGEGADEMFGGYQRYSIWKKLMWQERMAKLPFSSALPPIWPFKSARRLGDRDLAAYASVYHDFTATRSMFPDLVPAAGAREDASQRFSDFRERLFAVDQTAYLESLLIRQDKMSMAASVESRVPFVHLPVLRAANRIPKNMRVPGKETKPILKRVAESFLPHDLVNRRKIGLWLPYGDWIKDSKALGRYIEAVIEPGSRLAAFGDPKEIRQTALESDNAQVLFRLINVEMWLRSLDDISPLNAEELHA